jgi:hypothetical protein
MYHQFTIPYLPLLGTFLVVKNLYELSRDFHVTEQKMMKKTVKVQNYGTNLGVADHLHLCVARPMDLQGQGGVEA